MGASTTTRSGYLQPALVGGLVGGVLSALPVVSAGNVCCCLWVVTGGLVATYFLQQNRTTPITATEGALVGLLAGVAGAVVQVLVSIPIGLLVGPLEREMLRRVLDSAASLPPGAREMLEEYSRGDRSGLAAVVLRVFSFFVILMVGSLVSAVAGVVGAAIFARPGAPPTPASGPG